MVNAVQTSIGVFEWKRYLRMLKLAMISGHPPGPTWKTLTADAEPCKADETECWPQVGMRAVFLMPGRPMGASWNPPPPGWVPPPHNPVFDKTRAGLITQMRDGVVVEFTADDGLVFDPSVNIDSLRPEVPADGT